MKIIVNKKDRKLIEDLCDIALRAGGMGNLKEINRVLESIEEKEDE